MLVTQTECDAVNYILSAIGSAPVTTLEEDTQGASSRMPAVTSSAKDGTSTKSPAPSAPAWTTIASLGTEPSFPCTVPMGAPTSSVGNGSMT